MALWGGPRNPNKGHACMCLFVVWMFPDHTQMTMSMFDSVVCCEDWHHVWKSSMEDWFAIEVTSTYVSWATFSELERRKLKREICCHWSSSVLKNFDFRQVFVLPSFPAAFSFFWLRIEDWTNVWRLKELRCVVKIVRTIDFSNMYYNCIY